MVAVGIPLSILTVGIWHLLLPFCNLKDKNFDLFL